MQWIPNTSGLMFKQTCAGDKSLSLCPHPCAKQPVCSKQGSHVNTPACFPFVSSPTPHFLPSAVSGPALGGNTQDQTSGHMRSVSGAAGLAGRRSATRVASPGRMKHLAFVSTCPPPTFPPHHPIYNRLHLESSFWENRPTVKTLKCIYIQHGQSAHRKLFLVACKR